MHSSDLVWLFHASNRATEFPKERTMGSHIDSMNLFSLHFRLAASLRATTRKKPICSPAPTCFILEHLKSFHFLRQIPGISRT